MAYQNSDVDSTLSVVIRINSTMEPNDSSSNRSHCYEGKYCSKEEYAAAMYEYIAPQPIHHIFIILNIIVLIIGLVGNFLVCFAVWRNHHMRTVTNYFIVNLAVADFSVILVCLPATLVEDIRHTWYFGLVLCKILKALQPISVSVSVLTLSCIAIERWYAICRPLSFKSTAGRARTAIICIWIISICIGIPQLIVMQTHSPYADITLLFTICQPSGWSSESERLFWILLLVCLYFVPLVMMGVAYSMIARCLWKNVIPGAIESGHRSDGTVSGTGGAAETQLQARRKAAKMLIAVVIMFAVCYFPVFLFTILSLSGSLSGQDLFEFRRAAGFTAHLLCYSNSAVNPIIYNFMSAKFRKEFESACSCCLRPCVRQGERRRRAPGESTYNSYKYANNYSMSQTEQISMSATKTHT